MFEVTEKGRGAGEVEGERECIGLTNNLVVFMFPLNAT